MNKPTAETMTFSFTWENSVPILIVGLRDGNESAQRLAIEELGRMAKVADLAVAHVESLDQILHGDMAESSST